MGTCCHCWGAPPEVEQNGSALPKSWLAGNTIDALAPPATVSEGGGGGGGGIGEWVSTCGRPGKGGGGARGGGGGGGGGGGTALARPCRLVGPDVAAKL